MRKFSVAKWIMSVGIILCFAGSSVVFAGNQMSGTTFRIAGTEGIVHITDETGNDVSINESMLLYSGDTVQTEAKAYAYLNMDDSKLIKVDELSKATLKKTGKKYEVNVEEGSVYFEVSQKLADDESMQIGDSTVSLSIRGTTGVFTKRVIGQSTHHIIYLLEGKCVVSTPDAGNIQIWGGEKLDCNENTGELQRELISVKEIPGVAQIAITENAEIAAKVAPSVQFAPAAGR